MKYTFIATLVAIAMVVGASQPVQALTAAELQTQIQSLMQRIAELTKQLNTMQGSQGETISGFGTAVAFPAPAVQNRICAMTIRAIKQGERGDTVQALQEYLQGEGFFATAPTGYFGPMTREALAKWQGAQGFERAGVVGPKTLERIRMKCGFGYGNDSGRLSASPSSGVAPLTVTFSHYVGGFRPAGTTYSIDYGDGSSEAATECPAPADACTGPGTNTHTYRSDGTYTVTLTRVTDPCFGNELCRAAVHSEIIGKVQVKVGAGSVACTKEYKPVCGAKPVVCITTPCNPVPTTYGNRCMMNADGASFLYEGTCRSTTTDPANDPQCKAWYDGCNSCSRSTPGGMAACTLKYCAIPEKAYCTAYFDSTSNRPPTISGLSGPTTLAVGATGTWTVVASDPENGPLTYSVNWGENTYANASSAGAAAEVRQSTTFSHSYSQAGTYTVSVIVTDSAGQAAKTTTTVKVGETTVACTMQYDPVCGRPAGCANTCAPGQICPAICQLPSPQTYGNRCVHDAAGAHFIHKGECTPTSGNWY